MFSTILIFLILLSILIFVHEFGHFLSAKRLGIRVEEFGLGFPPKVWSKKLGETVYSLNLLPIGGFVRLTGEDESEETEDDPGSFHNQDNLAKAVVLSSGVLMNFALGIVLTGVVFAFLGMPQVKNVIAITEVVESSPAEEAGFKKEDLVIGYRPAFGGTGELSSVSSSEDFVQFVQTHLGEELVLRIKRNAEVQCVRAPCPLLQLETEIKVVPRVEYPKGQGPLGVVFVVVPEIFYRKIPLHRVPDQAFVESFKLVGLMVGGIGKLFKDLLVEGIVPKDIAGPVGIARLTGEVAQQGFFQLLQFTALLSINLGVINILPFPALDGGRLLFVGIEAVSGRKVHAKLQRWMHTVGIALLLLLMLIITFYDIVRIF